MLDMDYNEIAVGDKIEYMGSYDDDNSLYENCEDRGFIMKIISLDEEVELLWCDECPYAIQSALVRKKQ